MGVGRGEAQAYAAHDFKIRQIVPHVSDGLGASTTVDEKLGQNLVLRFRALIAKFNAQFRGAARHHGGLAPGNDGQLKTLALRQLDSGAVLGVKGLRFLPIGGVDQVPIGEHAVHIETKQGDRLGSRDGGGRKGLRSIHGLTLAMASTPV